jgi:hypothetical protein
LLESVSKFKNPEVLADDKYPEKGIWFEFLLIDFNLKTSD